MSDLSNVAPGGGESAPVAPAPTVTPAADTTSLTPSAAASALSKLRWDKNKKQAQASAEPSATEPEPIADDASAAPVTEQAPGDTEAATAEPEATELPPIEPPRSWTKEAKERWQSLPRETQDYLAQREQERDRELRRSQNEAAEQRKLIESERSTAEQARKQYEAALPALMQALFDAQAGEFSDVKTVEDVTKLADADPFRYLKWQAHQQKLQAVQAEITKAQERQQSEALSKLSDYRKKQDELFAEYAPDMRDEKKASDIRNKVVGHLTADVGFSSDELNRFAGNPAVAEFLFDARTQRLIYDAWRYNEAKKAPKIVASKPVPPVQQPGVAPPKGAAQAEHIKNLTSQLERTGDPRVAAELIRLRKAGGPRN